eukprot:8786125-Alexandrium_andersonii.AAC.1
MPSKPELSDSVASSSESARCSPSSPEQRQRPRPSTNSQKHAGPSEVPRRLTRSYYASRQPHAEPSLTHSSAAPPEAAIAA